MTIFLRHTRHIHCLHGVHCNINNNDTVAVRIAYRVRIMDAKFQVEVRPIDVSKIKTECVTNLTNVRITYRKKKKRKKTKQ